MDQKAKGDKQVSGRKNIRLRYGKGYQDVYIPEANILTVLYPKDMAGVPDEEAEIRYALNNPIESASLDRLVKGKERIAILASDITRPAPSYKMLPPLLDVLNMAGVTDEQITIYFGLGYHRGHTEDEQRQLVGSEVFERIKCVDHDINDCVYLGTTSRGTPVEVLKAVTESDLIIATGNLEIHYRAGYSGGYKGLMPGVCSKKTVQTNHEWKFRPGSGPGINDGNPMREDIEEAGQMGGVNFILNVVLNSKREIVKAVAGHPLTAHRRGCTYIDKMYKCEIPQLADIVIACTGGHPKDINLYQAQKGFDHASFAVRDGGIIILIGECPEGLGEKTFADWMLKAENVHQPVEWILQEFILGAHKAAVFCQVLERAQGYLVSAINPQLVRDIFFHPFDTGTAALTQALAELGADAKIIVMPQANSTLPILKK
ncbi:MAG TPA: nickel-dependent lactate racemase [bacterium]|nr:nickel-dependent lactate racemase [bacterium]